MRDIKDDLIRDLLDHEGAEGWSDSTHRLIELWAAKAPHYPMESAPRDGTRILLKYWPKHYKGYPYASWQRTPEPKWVEVWWVDKENGWGSGPHWEEWTGDPRSNSSQHMREEDCIGWLYRPTE